MAQKAGLDRSILDTARGRFFQCFFTRGEAGSEVIMLDTPQHKPSQT
jgi:hypothetical protein